MGKTKIPWADEVLNPVVGCSPCSPGCANCYAARVAHRLGQNPATPQYAGLTRMGANGPEWTGEQRWLQHVWKKACASLANVQAGTVVFIGSMADIFYNVGNNRWVWGHLAHLAYIRPHVEFVLVTKRVENLLRFANWVVRKTHYSLPNITGVATCCTQAEVDHNIPILFAAPLAKRAVCLEPLLESVRLTSALAPGWDGDIRKKRPVPRLNWVVTGCESGANRRHAETDWFRSLRDECVAAKVPFMLKQMEVAGRVVEMPELDGKVWDQTPWGGRS